LINPNEFMDEVEELHAFAIGFAEVICPWPPRQPAMSLERQKEIYNEYHYYMIGRAIGVYSWLVLAAIIKLLFF
jgi:hypothetical protein